MLSCWCIVLVLGILKKAQAINYCPPLGPVYTVPTKLSEDEAIQRVSRNLSARLDRVIESKAPQFKLNDTSFSINFFSAHESNSLFQYHYTAPILNSSSTQKVDENTIYRIGSITKLITVLALLVNGKVDFNDPVTNFIPELDALSKEQDEHFDATTMVRWSEITVGALASHLAGVGRSYTTRDLSIPDQVADMLGFPKLQSSEKPTCGVNQAQPLCSRQTFLDDFPHRHPVFTPFETPSYSNAAFEILGFVLERISNTSYDTVLRESILNPLGLKQTTLKKPKANLGIIPVGESAWDFDLGLGSSTDGIYSSTKDLSDLARAILKSTLLRPFQTRKWLKPYTHTASFGYSVGAPFEIYRTDKLTLDRRIIDIYSKLGSIGLYTSIIMLIPDYNVALAVLVAGNRVTVESLLEPVLESFIPVIEQVSKSQAKPTYSGLYRAESANSFVEIAVDDGPGLLVHEWKSNGNDLISAYKQLLQLSGKVDMRLYPTGLKSHTDKGTNIAFRAVLIESPLENTTSTSQNDSTYGLYPPLCLTWFNFDAFQYGYRGVNEFIFHLDRKGNAVSVEPYFLRQIWKRSG